MNSSIIRSVLNEVGLKPASFAKQIGVHPTQIYDLNSGKTKSISSAMADKILDKYPQFNRLYLLTGEGDMLNDTDNGEEADLISEESGIKPYFKEHSVTYVPVIHIDSVGGMHSQNLLTASEQYFERLIPFEEAREGDVAIYQSGDSMSPTIPAGALLLLRKVEDWMEYIGYGNVFVLWLRDDRRITKMVTRYNDDPKNYVWCVSYNPNVPDEELPRKMIREVWKVIKFQTNLGW